MVAFFVVRARIMRFWDLRQGCISKHCGWQQKGAVALLETELCHPKYRVQTIVFGTNTEPCQLIEKNTRLQGIA